MKSDYPVIICGAGPTGLMLAAQLLRFNIDFLIIDKKSGPTHESRAVVVQARSMEIYEQMNLSDDIVANAEKSDGVCFWRNGKKVSEIILDNFGSDITPFGFLLMYEQSKNETLLYHFLKQHQYDVEWNTELISYKQQNGFSVTLKKNNEEITVNTSYIIACDGANSRLRQINNMEFEGGSYENVFYVADTHIKAEVCLSKLNFFVSNNTFNLFFPMIGERRFRAIGILPKQFYHLKEITFGEVSEQVNKDAELELGFYDTQWYSTYRLHHKKIKTFNKDNIFFCGDAAHVHSPAGGQGMNTGLQDAYNLAWKLALVIQQKAKPALLATYHEERNPVAETLLKTTDRLFNIMAKNNAINILLRMYLAPAVMPALMKIQSFRRSFFLLVSQTEINYVHASLSKGRAGHIKAGMRFPYCMLSVNNKAVSVFHFIRLYAKHPFLLLYFNTNVSQPSLEHAKAAELENNEYNKHALIKAGFPSSFICILRPDNYIGYIAEAWNADEVNDYFHSFMN